MNPSEFLIVLGLFTLRLGIPILVMLAVIGILHRLDWRWQRAVPLSPAASCDPESAAAELDQTSLVGPCWEFKACSEEQRAHCIVFQSQEKRCWLAHLHQDGRLPGQCRTCGLFAATTLSPAMSHARLAH